MKPPHPIDPALCDTLAERAARGDGAARRALVEQLWPAWKNMVRASRSMRAMSASEDDVQNVVGALVLKISDEHGRALELHAAWRARHPDKTFEDWIRIVTANAVRDYVRQRTGLATGLATDHEDGPRLPSVKRMLNEFAQSQPLEGLGERPPMTAAQTARQLLEVASARLPVDQYRALTLWLEGAELDEIDGELGLAEDEGRRLVRAAVATLRRHFVGSREK